MDTLKATKQRPTINDILRKKKHEFGCTCIRIAANWKEAYCYKSCT